MAGSIGADPKSSAGRPSNKGRLLGQVATPQALARDMAKLVAQLRGEGPMRVLDPCVGSGVFGQALAAEEALGPDDSLVGFEIDASILRRAHSSDVAFSTELHCSDYLLVEQPTEFDAAILNPPYVRQEWLSKKERYQDEFSRRFGVSIPGTANLFVYFVLKSVLDLRRGGFFVCVLYDAWQSTRYGHWLTRWLSEECSDVQVVSTEKQPFDGALIDATVLTGRRKDRRAHMASNVLFETSPSPLQELPESVSIETLFQSRRGLRLKQTDFFLCDLANADRMGATPFVKKAGGVSGYRIPHGHHEAALLVAPDESPSRELRRALEARLQYALAEPESNQSVLNWYRKHPEKWYAHRVPPRAPIIFNYFMRRRPRHILNSERPYSDNFYGLIPKIEADHYMLLALLNSTATVVGLVHEARNQGSGLLKLQLFEYRRAAIPDFRAFDIGTSDNLALLGRKLAKSQRRRSDLIAEIDQAIHNCFSRDAFRPERLQEVYGARLEAVAGSLTTS